MYSKNIDSRDLDERLQELRALFLDENGEESDDLYQELSNSEREEYEELCNLRDEVGVENWDFGVYFIHEYEFEDYARELAEECYITDNNNPLMNFINWEGWADAVEMDYYEIKFQDETYLWREP